MAGGYVRKRATPAVVGTERRPASVVPTPPRDFDAQLRRIWRDLWRTPVAATWNVNDEKVVAVLCRLHGAVENGAQRGLEKLAGQIFNCSAQLGLNPRSRITLSIEERATPAPEAEAGRGRFTLSEAG